jgi:deoxyribose-phosphate aldolase
MNQSSGHGALSADQLEAILLEVGRQLMERGPQAVGEIGQWACTSLNVQVCPDLVSSALQAGACRVGVGHRDSLSLTGEGALASTIDHTLLKADTTLSQIDKLCAEAAEHKFASVCVNGVWVRRCAEALAGTGVAVCTVVGFPLGAMAPEAKAFEARRAVEDGACEVDMVLQVGALKSGEHDFVREDVRAVAQAVHPLGAKLKVILETCLLTDREKRLACELAKAAGADFVKTSTGFSTGGATVEDIRLMREAVGPVLGVKASGGVRDADDARKLIAAGATRIGASASVAIVSGGAGSGGY